MMTTYSRHVVASPQDPRTMSIELLKISRAGYSIYSKQCVAKSECVLPLGMLLNSERYSGIGRRS
jgi:hypothetical protein